jgi:hypothetical protein
VTLYGEVHRYGKKRLFGIQKVERVWRGKEYPAPEAGTKEFSRIMDEAMEEAEKVAERFSRADPQ